MLLLARLHIVYRSQTSNGRWCLSSSVVSNAVGRRAGRLQGACVGAAGQYGYFPLGRHLVINMLICSISSPLFVVINHYEFLLNRNHLKIKTTGN